MTPQLTDLSHLTVLCSCKGQNWIFLPPFTTQGSQPCDVILGGWLARIGDSPLIHSTQGLLWFVCILAMSVTADP